MGSSMLSSWETESLEADVQDRGPWIASSFCQVGAVDSNAVLACGVSYGAWFRGWTVGGLFEGCDACLFSGSLS